MPTPNALDTFEHEHVFLGRHHDENARRTWLVVGLTAAMMVGEIIAGAVFNSMALLADGFHMATHAGALTVAAIAYAYAKRHARSRRFSFGTGKVGDLAGFASAITLGVIALGIGVESVGRLFEPRPVAFTEATVVAVLGLIVNLVSAVLLSGGHHGHDHAHEHGHAHKHGHAHAHGHARHGSAEAPGAETHGQGGQRPASSHDDNNLRAAFVHVLADALTSVLAIAALLSGRYLGWVWLDPVIGIVGAIVISTWSWSLMRGAAAVLLDEADADLEAEVRRRLAGADHARITDLHVWRIGPGAHAAIVSVAGAVDQASLRERLGSIPALSHLTIEVR